MRFGDLATILLLLFVASCAPPARQPIDSAQQKWDETARRCRGDLLLVNADRTVPGVTGVSAVPGTNPSAQSDADSGVVHDQRVPDVPADVIENARRFTVAIRARNSDANNDTPPATLTANRSAESSGRDVAQGTGVILSEQGDILTNEHVIRAAERIDVHIADEGWRPARIIGVDAQSDLAVIRVDSRPLVPARLGNAGIVGVGRPVAALGYPAGIVGDKPAAFAGQLSSARRSLQGALDPAQHHFYAGLMESTASIPPGCSGGPLVDADGCVIGINTAAATDARTGRQFGYAIPMSDYTRSIVGCLCRGERVEHGYLGLLIRAPADDSPASSQSTIAGVVVERVIPDGPADRAGIRDGDVITCVSGTPVASAGGFAEVIRGTPIGTTLGMQVDRAGTPNVFSVVVARRPDRLASRQ